MHTGQQLPDDLQHRQAGETTQQYVARVAAAFDAPERADAYSTEWRDPHFVGSGRVRMWQAEKVDGPATQNITSIADYLTRIATQVGTLGQDSYYTGRTDPVRFTPTHHGVNVVIRADQLNNGQLRNIANAVRSHNFVRQLTFHISGQIDFAGLCILLDLLYARPDMRVDAVHGIDCALGTTIRDRFALLYGVQAMEQATNTCGNYINYCNQHLLDENPEIGDIANPHMIVADTSRTQPTPSLNLRFNPKILGYAGTGIGLTLSGLGAGFALGNLDFAFAALGNNVSVYQCLLLSGTSLVIISNTLLHYLRYTKTSQRSAIPPLAQYGVPAVLTLFTPLMIGGSWWVVVQGTGYSLVEHMVDVGIASFITSLLVICMINIDEIGLQWFDTSISPDQRNKLIASSLLFALANTTVAIMVPWALQNTMLFSDTTVASITVLSAAAITSTLMLLVNEIADATKMSEYERIL